MIGRARSGSVSLDFQSRDPNLIKIRYDNRCKALVKLNRLVPSLHNNLNNNHCSAEGLAKETLVDDHDQPLPDDRYTSNIQKDTLTAMPLKSTINGAQGGVTLANTLLAMGFYQ